MRREQLENQIRAATDALIRLDRIPDPADYPVDSVWFWRVKFPFDETLYTYIAVKCASGFWYGARKRFSDDGLREMIMSQEPAELWVATEWTRLDDGDDIEGEVTA